MESAIRTVVELVCGIHIEDLFDHANVIPVRGFDGVRYAELPITTVGPVPELLKNVVSDWNWLEGATLKVAICHGTVNAKKVMEDIRAGGKFSECHFIEFMACPGGCLGGGGQPIPTDPTIRSKRAEAIYAEDMAYPVRKSHLNQAVLRLYRDFLTDGIGEKNAHHLLHTSYTDRSSKAKM
jgi:NADH-quinone oxidoreductase subunit G/[NiFe] hydrogenase diaphorase moiety small subunit